MKMIKMYIQILAQMTSSPYFLTYQIYQEFFKHSLPNLDNVSCVSILSACIDRMQVSGRVCIDFFGRGERP